MGTLNRPQLSGMLKPLDLREPESIEPDLTFDEVLERPLRDEVDRRDGNLPELRVRRANVEHETTLEGFDLRFHPDVPHARGVERGSRAFVDRREDVLFSGPTGTGKSPLAQAWATGPVGRACRCASGRTKSSSRSCTRPAATAPATARRSACASGRS